MTRRMLILADDLSGASDCAIACVGSGLSAVVALGDNQHHLRGEVLSVDCDTRHLPPAAAATQMVRLLQSYEPAHEHLLYKKIDSTLRGNVAAELAAVLAYRRGAHIGPKRLVAILAPALPASGRTTVAGQALVNGEPLDTSETWQHYGASSSTHIPSLLALAGLRTAHIDLKHIRGIRSALREMVQSRARVADVLVCDAETEEDLAAVAQGCQSLETDVVWAGSAGLARHLPEAAGIRGTGKDAVDGTLISGPTLFVIGSMSRISREQVQMLGEQTQIVSIALEPAVLLGEIHSREWSAYTLQVRAALASNRDVVLTVLPGGTMNASMGRRLSLALAALVGPLADQAGALVASGGETARAIAECWGVTGLRMMGEVEPGIPLAVTEGWRRNLPVLTKAGAFGHAGTLVHCSRYLKSLAKNTESADMLIRKAV